MKILSDRERFALVPHSSATNTYQLFEEVIAAITANIERFQWSTWLNKSYVYTPEDLAAFAFTEPINNPSCGTMGCLFGWMVTLTWRGEQYGLPMSDDNFYDEREVSWLPEELHSELESLFMGKYGPRADWGYHRRDDHDSQETQQEYVDRAVRMMRRFMSDHEEVLKAHTFDLGPLVPQEAR